MVKIRFRTEYCGMSRLLKIMFNDGSQVRIWGDPAKAVAFLLIFCNAWAVRWAGRDVEAEIDGEACEALKALGRARLTWRKALSLKLLEGATPDRVISALSINVLLGGKPAACGGGVR
ncbi:MAG: hypothetical protein QW796_05950 [Thermoproteota archaeon]